MAPSGGHVRDEDIESLFSQRFGERPGTRRRISIDLLGKIMISMVSKLAVTWVSGLYVILYSNCQNIYPSQVLIGHFPDWSYSSGTQYKSDTGGDKKHAKRYIRGFRPNPLTDSDRIQSDIHSRFLCLYGLLSPRWHYPSWPFLTPFLLILETKPSNTWMRVTSLPSKT